MSYRYVLVSRDYNNFSVFVIHNVFIAPLFQYHRSIFMQTTLELLFVTNTLASFWATLQASSVE
tara:strand:- start:512 stop:703 length:192 start_codon:yes stop_codon:yes gene_type:complete